MSEFGTGNITSADEAKVMSYIARIRSVLPEHPTQDEARYMLGALGALFRTLFSMSISDRETAFIAWDEMMAFHREWIAKDFENIDTFLAQKEGEGIVKN